MIKDIISFKFMNLGIFSFLIYLASFAIPTGGLVLVLSFASVSIGISEFFIIFGITFVSSILGDISTYYFAKLFSLKATKLIGLNKSLKKSQEKVHYFFSRNGFYTIFLSRFLFSGLGPIVNYYCGFIKYNVKKFLLAILLGEFLYALIYTIIGIIFKEFISEILDLFSGLFVVIILIVAIIAISKKVKEELKI